MQEETAATSGTAALDGWTVLEAIADGLAVVDAEGKLRWINAALRRLDSHFHFRVGDDLIAGACHFFAAGPQLEMLQRGLREVLHGRCQRLELDCGCYGEGRSMSVAALPCPVEGRRGVLLQLVDTTERTSAAAEVRESEARWRRLVEGSPDIVFITDASSRLIYGNRALEQQSGYTPVDFQMTQAENRFIHPEDQERVAKYIADFVTSDRTYSDQIENRFITKHGEVLWVSSVMSKTTYRGEPALQFVCHNVTAEKQAIEQSALRLREAQEAIRSRDEFLSVAAHELKTPLTSVRGYAQLLLSRPPDNPDQLAHALSVIDRQVTKLTRLINRLLDLSQLEEGRLRLDRQRVDLIAIVREAIASVSRPGYATVMLHGPPALPAWVDPLRFEQVVTNIVDNAIHHSPPDRTVDVVVRDFEGKVELSVSDRGIGVRAEDRARVFERFYRAPGSRPGGFGLGLYISREIVHLHGGDICVESAEGGGACFRAVLPTDAPPTTERGH